VPATNLRRFDVESGRASARAVPGAAGIGPDRPRGARNRPGAAGSGPKWARKSGIPAKPGGLRKGTSQSAATSRSAATR